VFVVKYQSEADLKVFPVNYPANISTNNGCWYFCKYPNEADVKIFFVKYQSEADLKIYFVKYQSEAGWLNPFKKDLLY
jgi:hypothetical protein